LFLLAWHRTTGMVSAPRCNDTVYFTQYVWWSAISRHASWCWSLLLCQWCMLWWRMEIQCQKWQGDLLSLSSFFGFVILWCVLILKYTVSQKYNTDVVHYNFNVYQPILIILCRDAAERICYRTVICYPTSLTDISALPWETWTWKLHLFSHAMSQKLYCFGLLYLWLLLTVFNDFWQVLFMKLVLLYVFNFSCPFTITSLTCCEFTKAKMTHFWRYQLFANMPITKEDKILIKNLFTLECYNAKRVS